MPQTTLGAICSSNVGIQAGASDNTLFINDEKSVNLFYASPSPSPFSSSCSACSSCDIGTLTDAYGNIKGESVTSTANIPAV